MPTRTNLFLKQFPPEEHSWAGKVTLCFSYPIAGWIQLAVFATAYVQPMVVDFSNVYDPFGELAKWLEDIATGNLPSQFHFDEEGKFKAFRAKPVNEDEFIFEIIEPYWEQLQREEEPVYLYVQVARHQFLSEFLKRWDDFLENYYEPEHWEEYGSRLRELDMSKVRAFFGGKL
jgi:hypothetical protein